MSAKDWEMVREGLLDGECDARFPGQHWPGCIHEQRLAMLTDLEVEDDILATRLAQFDMAMASMDPKFREDFSKALSEIIKEWKEVPPDERALLVRILMEPAVDTQVADPEVKA